MQKSLTRLFHREGEAVSINQKLCCGHQALLNFLLQGSLLVDAVGLRVDRTLCVRYVTLQLIQVMPLSQLPRLLLLL